MLDTPSSEVVWRLLATHSIRQFPLHFPSRASLCAITFQLDSTTVLLLLPCIIWWYMLITLCPSEQPLANSPISGPVSITYLRPVNEVQGDTKKRELSKNPTKIEEIQQKKNIDRNWTIITDYYLIHDYQNGEVVCSPRSLFRSAANCTWQPLCISKVPVFLCHPV